MKRALRILGAVWLMLGCCWAQAPTPSGEQPVRFLYPIGKTYRSDTIVPLIVELNNTTTRTQSYRITWPLDLALPEELAQAQLKAGERRRFPLYFPRNTLSQLYSLEVDGTSYSPDLQSSSRTEICAVLSTGEDKFDYLRSLKLTVDPNAPKPVPAAQPKSASEPSGKPPEPAWVTLDSLATLEAELLPESWVPLASLDTIVVYNLPALSLSSRQKEALLAWCYQGGRLVLVSDGVPEEYRGTPFEPHLPMSPQEVITTDGLAQLVGPVSPTAQVLAEHQGRPLLLGQKVLRGELFLLTAPIKQLEPLSVEQAENLWRQVLPPPPDPNSPPNYNSYRPRNSYGGTNVLRDIPELPRAKAGWLALYLLSYAVIVGPINLTLLRRKDKMLWSFVSIPVIALLFAGGAYLLNLANRSSVPLLRELGTANFRSGESLGLARSEALFFSPSAQRYRLNCAPTAICFSDTYSYRDKVLEMHRPLPGGGLQAVLNLSTWDIFSLQTESLLRLSGPIRGRWKDGVLTLDSSLASASQEALLYHPKDGVSPPFTLQAGAQTHQLSMDSTPLNVALSPLAGASSQEHPGREELLQNVSSNMAEIFPNESGYLIFWSDQLRVPIMVTDKTVHKAEYLVIVELES